MATYWENSCSFGLRYVSWYKYLIVSLVFSHLGFWSGNLFLIAPFPDLCLLVPFNMLHMIFIYGNVRGNKFYNMLVYLGDSGPVMSNGLSTEYRFLHKTTTTSNS